MESQVVFYRLGRKIVSNQSEVPEEARQVMYYSLAIGHHVGVMDCLSELVSVPLDVYRRCVEALPEGAARRKLEGALTWQEIEINRSHVEELMPALNGLLTTMQEPEARWVTTVIQSLRQIMAEPALYLMVKMRA